MGYLEQLETMLSAQLLDIAEKIRLREESIRTLRNEELVIQQARDIFRRSLKNDVSVDICRLVRSGSSVWPVSAFRLIRKLTNLSMYEAKEVVDHEFGFSLDRSKIQAARREFADVGFDLQVVSSRS